MNDSYRKSSQLSSNFENSQIKSISLNIISNNSYNLNDGRILENNKENSYCDKDLNEKIIKLLIGNHTLLPMKTIEKIAYCNFINNHLNKQEYYNTKIIDEIIHNENSHIVAEFKDYLIKGDISEFLQQYYKKKESLNLLPKIYEYYISCSVIFPNYVILPESKYIYKNIQRKQRVIDIQQEQEDKEENIKNGLFEQEKEPTIFNTQALDSILNQTDTSGVKLYFGISPEVSKGGGDPGMMKLLNNIDNAEKKMNININNKKSKITVCKLKKGNINEIIQYQNTMLLNEGRYSKKIQSAINKKKSGRGLYERKNSGSNNINEPIQNLNKNNLKQLLKQNTENNKNFNKKRSIFSTQITYIDSFNNHMKNAFDLKGIESIKKLKKYSKKIKENKNEKEIGNQFYKNNSQAYGSLKILNSKEKHSESYYIKDNKDKENINQYNIYNKKISGDLSINQSDNKNIKKNNSNHLHQKEIISRNNGICKIDNNNNNIKTYFDDPIKNLTQKKTSITSYKTKNQKKHKTNGYQTSRNKFDNKNIFLNISKSNISKNHQSIDSELNNNHVIKRAINQLKNKHNKLKNNLITALLGSGNNKKKKITKNILIQKDNNSIIDSFDTNNFNFKEKNTNQKININNNEKISLENNDNKLNNNKIQKDFNDNNINNIFLYNLEKNNSKNKRIISTSNLDGNNKISTSSCTKGISINSYTNKRKNSNSNINNTNHKKQISTSKIPTSIPENKTMNNNKNKKNNKEKEDIDNKNKLNEFIDNYLDDYFSSKIKNKCNNSQSKNFNQDEYNNNNNNININNYFYEPKNKSKNTSKNEILSSAKNIQDKKNEKDENNKIKNRIFNFEKRITKKLSEKNLNIFDKFKTKSTPKNWSTKKTSSIRKNKSGNHHNKEHGPLSARESNSKYQINAEILSNKIQKIKQSMKETSDKGSNSISSIFKKKKYLRQGERLLSHLQKKVMNLLKKNHKLHQKQEIKNLVMDLLEKQFLILI